MTIYGLSQSSGMERMLNVEQVEAGILLHARDKGDRGNYEPVIVAVADLLATLIDRPAGGTRIEGASPAQQGKTLLDVEVRGNEVLLQVRPEAGGWDIAVGLDDFQDALEQTTEAA